MERYVSASVYLTPAQVERLKEEAEWEGTNFSELVRRIIEDYFGE